MGVGAAGGLHDHPGQAEEAREDRAGQLDGLNPLEAHLAVLAEEHPAAKLDLSPAHPESGEAPRDPVDRGNPGDEDDERQQREERVGDHLLERPVVTVLTLEADVRAGDDVLETEGTQEAVEELRRGVAQDRDEDDSASQQRGQGVQPLPLPRWRFRGGLSALDGPFLRRCRIRLCHRPARCASPRADSRSRNASASATGSPGSEPPLSGEAVWISHDAMPWARMSGPDWMSTYWRRP